MIILLDFSREPGGRSASLRYGSKSIGGIANTASGIAIDDIRSTESSNSKPIVRGAGSLPPKVPTVNYF